jgi:hypothetical protein
VAQERGARRLRRLGGRRNHGQGGWPGGSTGRRFVRALSSGRPKVLELSVQ